MWVITVGSGLGGRALVAPSQRRGSAWGRVHAGGSLRRPLPPPWGTVVALWLYLVEQLSRKVPELAAAAVEKGPRHVAVEDPDGDLEHPGICNSGGQSSGRWPSKVTCFAGTASQEASSFEGTFVGG